MSTQSVVKSQTESDIQALLIKWTASELNVKASEINPRQSFLSYNMDSVTSMMLVGDLEDWLGCRLSPTLVWDYPDIETLAKYLATESESVSQTSLADDKQTLNDLDKLSEENIDALINHLLTQQKA